MLGRIKSKGRVHFQLALLKGKHQLQVRNRWTALGHLKRGLIFRPVACFNMLNAVRCETRQQVAGCGGTFSANTLWKLRKAAAKLEVVICCGGQRFSPASFWVNKLAATISIPIHKQLKVSHLSRRRPLKTVKISMDGIKILLRILPCIATIGPRKNGSMNVVRDQIRRNLPSKVTHLSLAQGNLRGRRPSGFRIFTHAWRVNGSNRGTERFNVHISRLVWIIIIARQVRDR